MKNGEHLTALTRKLRQVEDQISPYYRQLLILSLLIPGAFLGLTSCGPLSPVEASEPPARPSPVGILVSPTKFAYLEPSITPAATPIRTETPKLIPPPEPTKTTLQMMEVGKSFELDNSAPNPFITIVSIPNMSKVVIIDSFHNYRMYNRSAIELVSQDELIPGLTIQKADEAIQKYIHYDSSIPSDRRAQGSAMILQFLTTFPEAFPRDNQGNVLIGDVFSPGVRIGAANPKREQGFYDDNTIALDLEWYLPEMTNYTASYIHELLHYLINPGYDVLGLNEGLVESANELSLNISVETSFGISETDMIMVTCKNITEKNLSAAYGRWTEALKYANFHDLPGVVDFLISEGIKNRLNHGKIISTQTAELMVERHYTALTGRESDGNKARKYFHDLLINVLCSPNP